MRHPKTATLTVLALATVLAGGCAVRQNVRSSALEYLYPSGAPPAEPRSVSLTLPVRVGVGFAPGSGYSAGAFSETQKKTLLDRVAEAFRGQEGIAAVEPIPSTYLTAGGSFAELDRLKSGFGIDLVALISYDQFQASESGKSSWLYWTIIGAYVVKGEKQETRTVLDAVIYDIPSRSMLFRAAGQSSSAGSATPADAGRKMRRSSEEGLDIATDDLIANLAPALAAFREQAATGTVRGPGTPEIAMFDAEGNPVGQGGAGSFGPIDALIAALVAGAAGIAARRSPER